MLTFVNGVISMSKSLDKLLCCPVNICKSLKEVNHFLNCFCKFKNTKQLICSINKLTPRK